MPVYHDKRFTIWNGWESVYIQVLKLDQSPNKAIKQSILCDAGDLYFIKEEELYWLE